MTKPTDEQIKEAMEWVDSEICGYEQNPPKYGIERLVLRHLRTIRSALKEYKPKMVTREWVGKATEFLCEMSESGELKDVHLVAILDELGIEVGE